MAASASVPMHDYLLPLWAPGVRRCEIAMRRTAVLRWSELSGDDIFDEICGLAVLSDADV
jgi:hypothetical protein